MLPASDRPTIRFGTDGWRALVGGDFTYANVRLCAAALAAYLQDAGLAAQGAVVGYDTRFISDRFAVAVAQTLSQAGIDVHLFDRPAPTPAASFAITRTRAGAGVVVTASHNPPEWNGFKVKSSQGGSAPPEMVLDIEQRLEKLLRGEPTDPPQSRDTQTIGKIEEFDPAEAYVQRLSELVDVQPLRNAGLSIIVDAMHGSGAGIISALLAGGPTRVNEIRHNVNPAFPDMAQPEPIQANLQRLCTEVRERSADVGLAFDGDADRLGVVDERGVYLSTLEVFSLIAQNLIGRKRARGGVACTITMSSMVDRLCEEYGAPVIRTPVGFKFVGPAMLENDCALGGEESGGYAFRGHVPERDGPLSGLIFLEAMVQAGKKPSRLLADLHELTGPHTFRRIDAGFPEHRSSKIRDTLENAIPDSLGNMTVEAVDRRDGVKFHLAGGAWAAARLSGTEPLVRLYAETPDEQTLAAVLGDLRAVLGI